MRTLQRYRRSALPLLSLLLLATLVGCRCKDRFMIMIDGSSTVYPIHEAVAEEYIRDLREKDLADDLRITIGVSGTGGGFEKFCRGEIDIAGASRPIKQIEIDRCAAAGIEFLEIPIAYDGIAAVVHPDNDWAHDITVAELKRIYEPEAQGVILNWNQVRPEWPDRPLRVFGAGVDSGTYDYFTAAIVGKEHSSRGDFTSSEDDNVLVQGVSRDINAIGFFGFAYYEENRSLVRALAIDNGVAEDGDGPQMPTVEGIANGTYQPLSRAMFIYVRKDKMDEPKLSQFINFYLNEGRPLMNEVGYVALQESTYELAIERAKLRTAGSMLGGGGSRVGISLDDLMRETNQ